MSPIKHALKAAPQNASPAKETRFLRGIAMAPGMASTGMAWRRHASHPVNILFSLSSQIAEWQVNVLTTSIAAFSHGIDVEALARQTLCPMSTVFASILTAKVCNKSSCSRGPRLEYQGFA